LGSSFTSFLLLFFKRANSNHWWFFLSPDIIFNSNLENTCSQNLVEEEKNDYSWWMVGRKVEWTFVIVLKEWK
jgi:hypothetical protein